MPRALLGVYAAAIFLSAALLFSVQPLFTKLVLPALGGSPSVWSVGLVLFQGALLGGYLYAHCLTRYLPGRASVLVHVGLLSIAALWLPLGVNVDTKPGVHAELWMVAAFATSIGVPFFALSANAPLLQAWFARTGHPAARDPYFLYAASNVGSFLSLLSYPFVVEPFLGLGQQTRAWSLSFLLLGALVLASGGLLLRSRNAAPAAAEHAAGVRAADAARWVALAAVPSALLVAVTAHVSTDVAAVPLLWVPPLALYLLTFVIAFQTKPLLSHALLVRAQPLVLVLLVVQLIGANFSQIWLTLGVNLAALFVSAMVCHGELARRRPAPSQLTAFYLWLSVGGVIGGIFAGLVAPNVFEWIVEYPLLIVCAVACRPPQAVALQGAARSRVVLGFMLLFALLAGSRAFGVLSGPDALKAALAGVLLAAVFLLGHAPRLMAAAFAGVLALNYTFGDSASLVQTARSFFGVHRVQDSHIGDTPVRLLLHGTTIHGAQRLEASAAARPETIAYFGADSPMARLFRGAKANTGGPLRAAVVGLGVGTVSCFTSANDTLDFYEIDPEVVRIATDPRLFDYIARCKPDSRIILGDARLTIAEAPARSYDLILLDAFSSDAVPVHLLTREAMALYASKLAPGGLIGAHAMNRHMDLVSVIAGIGEANHLTTRVLAVPAPADKPYVFSAKLAVLAEGDAAFRALLDTGSWEPVSADASQRLWTDDYSNVVGAIWRRYAHSGS